MSSISVMLLDLGKKIIVNIIYKNGVIIFQKFKHQKLPFAKRRNYKISLERSIKDMPFIYKDMDNEVLTDFVDIEIDKLKTKGLELTEEINSSINNSGSYSLETLNDYSKILILGSPGIGKSTFMRYATLSVLKRKTSAYLNNKLNLTPIFIPLKAIENNYKSPLIKYILDEISLFDGDKGFKKLLKMAQSKQIFLVLDGYDEISYSENQKFIQYEINLLLTHDFQIAQQYLKFNLIEKKYVQIYKSLSICKVWLSTREEFYRINPLINMEEDDLKHFSVDTYQRYLAITKLKGLGDKRIIFIKNIFNRYKNKAQIFNENLDDELFISQIANTADKELNELSKTPLFLTIMCYLYAEDVKNGLNESIGWKLNIDTLIEKCIDVLLDDIDSFKVRNLTKAQRKAFLMRRSDFKMEKIAFLEFISYELFIDDKQVFDAEYLNEKVDDFLKVYPQFYDCFKVIQHNDRNNPNIIRQLIYSGIFTNVGIVSKDLKFDFPHRRFREILTLNYINSEEKLLPLLNKIGSGNIVEILILIFEKRTTYRNFILNWLLAKTINLEQGIQSEKLIFSLRENETFYDSFEQVIHSFITNKKSFLLKSNLLGYFKFTSSFYTTLGIYSKLELDIFSIVSIRNLLQGRRVINEGYRKLLGLYLDKPNNNYVIDFLWKLRQKNINANLESSIEGTDLNQSTILTLSTKIANEDRNYSKREKNSILSNYLLSNLLTEDLLFNCILEKDYIECLNDEQKVHYLLNEDFISKFGFKRVFTFLLDVNYSCFLRNNYLNRIYFNEWLSDKDFFKKIIDDYYCEKISNSVNKQEKFLAEFVFIIKNYHSFKINRSMIELFINYLMRDENELDFSEGKIKKFISSIYFLNPELFKEVFEISPKLKNLFDRNNLIDIRSHINDVYGVESLTFNQTGYVLLEDLF